MEANVRAAIAAWEQYLMAYACLDDREKRAFTAHQYYTISHEIVCKDAQDLYTKRKRHNSVIPSTDSNVA